MRPANAVEPPDYPVVSFSNIHDLLEAASRSPPPQRVMVRGIVTSHHPDGPLFIEDHTGGLFIDTLTNSTVAVDDWVEVTGAISLEGYSPVLKRCFYRATGQRGSVNPALVTSAELYSGKFDMRLVQFQGKLVNAPDYRAPNLTLLLDVDHRLVWTYLNDREHGNVLSQLRPGSLLRATGVCSVGMDEQKRLNGIRVHLRSAGDVMVLHGPPWWTLQKTLAALGAAGAIALISLAWVASLRSLNQRLLARTRQLRALTQQLTLAEQRERRRIAQILHDHLQQLLAGVKYQLSALGHSDHPSAKQTLAEIGLLLDETIQVSRSLTAELSPPILHQSSLLATLQWLKRWMADKHGLTVELVSHGTIPPLEEDVKVLLFESVRELLYNVVKHSGVQAATVILHPVNQHQIKIIVQDLGSGFDPGRLKLAAESNAGFGLFNFRERIEAVGGRFKMESVPGKGSRFELSVPSKRADVLQPLSIPTSGLETPVTAPDENTQSQAKISILLVDDHTVVREALARMLSVEPDLQIIGQATNGLEAVSFVDSQLPQVILMDISMPKLNGIDATRIIHRKAPQIRIIGLSMFDDADQARAMLEAGAVHYLTKSSPSDVLLKAIRNLLSPLQEDRPGL